MRTSFFDELHDAAAGEVGLRVPAGIDGWNRGVVRQRQAERFHHRGHASMPCP